MGDETSYRKHTRQARESTGLPKQRPFSLQPRDVLTLWVFKRCSQPKYLCEISTHCQSNESHPQVTIFKSISTVMFIKSVYQYQRIASNLDKTLAKTWLEGHFLLLYKYWTSTHIYYHTMKTAFFPHKGSFLYQNCWAMLSVLLSGSLHARFYK